MNAPAIALLFAVSPAQAEQLINVNERRAIDLVVLIPGEALSILSVSTIQEAFAEKVSEQTDLFVRPLESSIESCAGDLLCLSRIIRSTRQEESGAAASPLVLVVSARSGEGGDALLIVLLDQSRSERVLSATTADDEKAVEIAEKCISRFGPRIVSTPGDLMTIVDEALLHFRSAFEQIGSWRALGSIAVHTKNAGAELDLDGRAVAITDGRVTVLQGLRSGRRVLTLSQAEFAAARVELDVSPGSRQEIEIQLSRDHRSPFWVDAVVAGAFVAGGVAALSHGVESSHNYITSCVELNDSCTLGFTRVFGGDDQGLYDRGVGPLSVPLGYSMIVSGVTLVGSRFLGFEEESFMFRLGIGLASGAAVYLVSEGANALIAD